LVFIDSGICGVDAGVPEGSPTEPTLSSANEQLETRRTKPVKVTIGSQNLRGITAAIIDVEQRHLQG
jgi:hypothetical protein